MKKILENKKQKVRRAFSDRVDKLYVSPSARMTRVNMRHTRVGCRGGMAERSKAPDLRGTPSGSIL